jgi:hypothetical protein
MNKIILALAVWLALSGLAFARIGVNHSELTYTHHFYTGAHYYHPGCVPPPPPRWR